MSDALLPAQVPQTQMSLEQGDFLQILSPDGILSLLVHTEDTQTGFSVTTGMTRAVTTGKYRRMLPLETDTHFRKLHLTGYL